MARNGSIEEAPRYVASYLWNERLFGMKTKRLGPTILASEVIIPITSAAAFIEKAKKMGGHFGVEICIDSYIIDAAQGAHHVHLPVRFQDQEILYQHAPGFHAHQGRGGAGCGTLRAWPLECRLYP